MITACGNRSIRTVDTGLPWRLPYVTEEREHTNSSNNTHEIWEK